MIYLFKLFDLLFSTNLYFFVRIEEISDLVSEHNFELAEKMLLQLQEDLKQLQYPQDFLAELYFYLSELYFKWNKPQNSLDYCLAALKISGSDEHLYRIGWIYLNSFRNTEKTLEYLERCLETNPHHYPSLKLLGEVYHELQNLDQAEKYLRLSLPLKKEAGSYLRIGEILLVKENYKEAFKFLRISHKLKPDNPEVNYYIGCTFLRANNHNKALHYFRQATYYDDQYIPAYFEIARIHQLIFSETDKAIIAYNKILELMPENEEALYQLAQIFCRSKKNYHKALFLLFKLLKKDPSHSQSLLLMSEIYEQCYNYSLALKYLGQLEIESAEIKSRIAEIQFRLCNWQRAEELYIELYQKGLIEFENKIKKIVLFPHTRIATFLAFKKEQDSLNIYAVKRNGPFQIDTLMLRLLKTAPTEDIFYTFEPFDFSLEEGFLILSRWLSSPVLTFGQDFSELSDLCREAQLELPLKGSRLDDFLYSIYGKDDFKELETAALKKKVKTMIDLFQGSLKKIRDSHLLVSLFSKLPELSPLAHLPQVVFKPNFLAELLTLPAEETSRPVETALIPQELTAFLNQPNFEGSWRVLAVPLEQNLAVVSLLKEQAERKKVMFAVIAKDRGEFHQAYHLLSRAFTAETLGFSIEPDNFLCLSRLSELIKNNAYPTELFYLICWYRTAVPRLFPFIPEQAFKYYPQLSRVLLLLSATERDHENCQFSSHCEYYQNLLALKNKKIVLFSLQSYHREIVKPSLIPGCSALISFNFAAFPKISFLRSSFALLKMEANLLYWHQALFAKGEEAIKFGEEKILKIKENLLEVKRILNSIHNHYFLPEEYLDLDSLKVKFPFLYFSLLDALLPLLSSLKEFGEFLFCTQIIREQEDEIISLIDSLNDFLYKNAYRSLRLSKNIEETEFLNLLEINYHQIGSSFNNLIFVENHLTCQQLKALEKQCPGKKLSIYDAGVPRAELPPAMDWETVEFFEPEIKYLFRNRLTHFWVDFYKFHLQALFSAGTSVPGLDTLSFILKKKLKYHYQISRENLDHVVDNLFYHTDNHGFYEFLSLALSETEKTIPLTFKQYSFLIATSTIISRIEGKRVLILADGLLGEAIRNVLKWLYYVEVVSFFQGTGYEDFLKSLECIKDSIPRIIVLDFPHFFEPKVRQALDRLKVDYRFSLTYNLPEFKCFLPQEAVEFTYVKLNFSLHQELSPLSELKDGNVLDLKNLTITPQLPLVENLRLLGLPFDMSELGFYLSSASSLEICSTPEDWENFQNGVESLDNMHSIDKINQMLHVFRGRNMVISRRLLSKIVKNTPFWRDCESFINYLIQEGVVGQVVYHPPYQKFHLKQTLNTLVIDLNNPCLDLKSDELLSNQTILFQIRSGFEQSRKKWLEDFMAEIKLLEFLNRDHELAFKRKKCYQLSSLQAELSLPADLIEKVLLCLTSLGFLSYARKSEEIMLEITANISLVIKFWLTQKEIKTLLLDKFVKSHENDDSLDLLTFFRFLHQKFGISELILEESVLDLQCLELVEASFEQPFLADGYTLEILKDHLTVQSLENIHQQRVKLCKLLKNKLKEGKNKITFTP
ncbi:MAG: CDC27 family protein [Candidatus Wallbacteria bacterium]|nr:CDC27 family protein [Candidatus Wallbacteria bacterium]